MTTDLGAGVLQRWKPAGAAQQSLYGIAQAGGGAAELRQLAEVLSDHDVVGVRLAGRERRIDDILSSDPEVVAAEVAAAIALDRDAAAIPCALLGQCSGAWLALAVAARLELAERPVGLLVIVSQAPPPSSSSPGTIIDGAASVREVVDGGAIPPEVAADSEMMEMILPTLRSDLLLAGGLAAMRPRVISSDILVVYGSDDVRVDAACLGGWREWTTGGLKIEQIPGGHLPLRDAPAALGAVIKGHATGG